MKNYCAVTGSPLLIAAIIIETLSAAFTIDIDPDNATKSNFFDSDMLAIFEQGDKKTAPKNFGLYSRGYDLAVGTRIKAENEFAGGDLWPIEHNDQPLYQQA